MPVQTPIIAEMFRTRLAVYLPKLVPNFTKLSWRGVRQLACVDEMASASSIFSLSSGHGKCGVAVIRVSGPKAGSALKEIGRFARLPEPRRAVLRKLWHPRTNQQIDRGLVIWFPGAASFTGEDSCEFHVHGGPAVVSATLHALGSIPTLRPAEPGEFTKRAFQNDKLDLTKVEGLGDLIHAETEYQHRQALRQTQGDLSKLYGGWRQRLLKCTANLEAYIDFSENDNLEDGILEQVFDDVQLLISEIERHLADSRRGEILRSGVRVSIIGEPNVGKSSLLNLLCQRPVSIVSSVAGTTRDVIEKTLDIAGYPVVISDTAGMRLSDSPVEKEGVRRAVESARNADLNILVLDACDQRIDQSQSSLWTLATQSVAELGLCEILETSDHSDSLEKNNAFFSKENTLVIINKSDLLDKSCEVRFADDLQLAWCPMSCVTRDGLQHFMNLLEDKIKVICGDPALGEPSLTQVRHRTHLNECTAALHRYNRHHTHDVVLAAHALHAALRNIGKITGHVTSDELLAVIFRDFCIGK